MGNKDFCLFICEKKECSQTVSEILRGQTFSPAISHGTESVCAIPERVYLFYCILVLPFPPKTTVREKTCTIDLAKLNYFFFPPQNRRQNKRIDKHPHRLKKQTNKLFQLIQNEVLKQVNSCFICETRMEWGLQLNSCSRCVQLLFRADSAAQEIVCSV